jgi:UDP-N-acetylglucosamine--N-acetylmuramyl-(pentapeptide) pyrophosphoryl-undecaprenol N-acetylglucosamine transferase
MNPDITPGLATKITAGSATKICVTFPETLNYVSKKKAVHTGTPIRAELFSGEKAKGTQICGFNDHKPVVLVMGGSLGSVKINTVLRQALPALIEKFNIVHLCGKGNLDETININSYKQYEYLSDGLPHILALADVVISRAGSNSINEFLALRKPSLLIPLSKKASRGDQILNASSFKNHGYADVLPEEALTPQTLTDGVLTVFNNRGACIANMKKSPANDGVGQIIKIISLQV